MKIEKLLHILRVLGHALDDPRNMPSAYPILADYGLMDRTENGFKCIDPDTIRRRIRDLIITINQSDATNQETPQP